MANRQEEKDRLNALLTRKAGEKDMSGQLWSRLVRGLRLVLPLLALGLAGLLFAWPRFEQIPARLGPVEGEQTVGRNELLSPRFESRDEGLQPYTITATRAVQSRNNSDLVLLDKPMADITLNNGAWLAAEADKGAFEQDSKKLLLQGDVRIFHDQGYEIVTDQIYFHIETETAYSDTALYAQGPEGILEAEGFKADNRNGRMIFAGPAKLTLRQALPGLQ